MHRHVLRGEVDLGVEFARVTRERALAEGDRALAAEAAHRTGELLLEGQRTEDALDVLRTALEEREGVFGADHASTACTRSFVAWALWELGRAGAARDTMARSLVALPPEPTQETRTAVATVYGNAGGLAESQERTAQALSHYRRALALHEGCSPPEMLEVASACVSLATAEEHEGRLDEARALLDRALEIRRRELGEEHLYVAYTLDHLAGNLLGKGDLDAARRLYEQGAATIERCRGPAHHSLSTPLAGLATIAAMSHDEKGALELARRAVAVSEASFGAASPHVAQPVVLLATLQATCGRSPALTAPLWRRAAELWLPVHATHGAGLCECFNNLALCLRAQGRLHEFLDFAGPVLGRLERDPEASPDLLAALANALSEAHFQEGRSREALGLLQRALALSEARDGPNDPRLLPVLTNLASVLHSLQRGPEARECERRIRKLRRRGAWN